MPVTVSPYDPSWAQEFADIKKELEAALEGVPFVSIEHVGSTSIPHLAAKPILDIEVVATREQLQSVLEALQHPNLQLIYMGELGIADRYAFRAPQKLPGRNLYVCIEGSAALRNHLAVRDLLRSDQALRREYVALKCELAVSGMEIHEYMSAKVAFVLKMLRLSKQLTEAEIDDYRRATSSAVRMAPIKTEHLVMRKFVIGDVDALLQAGLAPTIKEAEELAVEIIRNAGMAKRRHVELAVIVREDREGAESLQMVGRVGVRVIEDIDTIGTDGSLRRVLDAMLTESKRVGRMSLLYVFFDPSGYDAAIAKSVLDAFVPALAQTVQKAHVELGIATDTNSETVWHLLEGSGLLKIDDSQGEGGIVFQINSPT